MARSGKAKSTSELLKVRTDTEGRRYMGDPNEGCYNCGTVEMAVSEDGKFIFYYPGIECCPPKIARLIDARNQEIKHQQQILDDAKAKLGELYDAAEVAMSGAAADRLGAQIKKAENGNFKLTKIVQTRIMALAEERSVLYKKLSELEAAQKPSPDTDTPPNA